MSFTVTYANPKVFSIIRLTPYLGIQGQYVVFTDGTATWRKGVRYSYFVLDKALTVLGFSGDEDIDWENVRELGGARLGYGLLYNWYAATDVRNISNTGWHLPTSAEWDILIAYLIANGYGYEGSGDDIAKSVASIVGWTVSVIAGYTGNDQATNNNSKFNICPGGVRSPAGSFFGEHNFTYFWSATADTPVWIITYGVQAYANTLAPSHYAPNGGEAIRLVKDSTILTDGQTGTYIGNDGRVYGTICIGTQEWLSENLVETKYRDGTTIPEVTDAATWTALITGALCAYNNDWTNI
jgi:uncharacterized protein (TIGR02145 family)